VGERGEAEREAQEAIMWTELSSIWLHGDPPDSSEALRVAPGGTHGVTDIIKVRLTRPVLP